MTEHIVALFENDTIAAAAERGLLEEGIPQSAIRRYAQPTRTAASTPISGATATSSETHHGGFWAWLMGDQDSVETQRAQYPRDHEIYEGGVERGNAVLSVTVMDAPLAERAIAILEDHSPLELDEDAPAYRDTSGITTGSAYRDTSGITTGSAYRDTTSGTPTGVSSKIAGTTAPRTGEDVIPLKEEEVNVGKRMVDGTTRVRRYVVEKPVEQDVTLRGEKVTIERRAPVSGADGGAFEDRTVEVRESHEVPDVQKSSRVVEEVVIKKEGTERTERVRDTVRREEVEVSNDKTQTPTR